MKKLGIRKWKTLGTFCLQYNLMYLLGLGTRRHPNVIFLRETSRPSTLTTDHCATRKGGEYLPLSTAFHCRL